MSNVYADDAAGRKATRIINEGRIQAVDDATVYVVDGDHGTYLTVLHGPAGAFCSCPSTEAACSHVRAAMRMRALTPKDTDSEDDPFAGLNAGR